MNASRYSCQIALPGFGTKGQQLLSNAKVLIVGAGGLGCPAAQYLASSGIGTLGIADDDTVSTGNLHRQVLYTPADAGKLKVNVAAERLKQQNPDVNIIPHALKVTETSVMELFAQYDIIADCTDNFETRYLLNDAAVLSGKPLVYGAIYQYEGQVAVWNMLNTDGTRSPNYRDLFPQVDATQVPNCAVGGVIPTIAGMIGCMQANEVIKYVTNTGELLSGKMLMLNVQTMQSRIIKTGGVTKTNITQLTATVMAATMTVAEVKAGLASGNVELIDIRWSEEHDDFNIGGRNIAVYRLERTLSEMGPETIFVLYCTIGKRSADVVQKLKESQPQLQVFSLEGGIRAWVEQG